MCCRVKENNVWCIDCGPFRFALSLRRADFPVTNTYQSKTDTETETDKEAKWRTSVWLRIGLARRNRAVDDRDNITISYTTTTTNNNTISSKKRHITKHNRENEETRRRSDWCYCACKLFNPSWFSALVSFWTIQFTENRKKKYRLEKAEACFLFTFEHTLFLPYMLLSFDWISLFFPVRIFISHENSSSHHFKYTKRSIDTHISTW